MKETVRVREAREPRKKRYVQNKEEEEHRLVHQSSRRDIEVLEYSNLMERRGVFRVAHKLPDPSSIIGVPPLSEPRIITRFIYNVCIEERVSVLERLSIEMVK